MEEFLKRLNFVKNHNYIKSLENKNTENEKKIKKYVQNSKDAITELEKDKIKLKKQIEELEECNKNITEENKYYKNLLNRVPNWIIKLFVRKNNKLGGFLNE